MFDLGKPMFMIECLAHILYNSYKAGVMDVKYDDGRVDNEATRRNMQLCITCTKKTTKGGKGFGDSAEVCETSL